MEGNRGESTAQHSHLSEEFEEDGNGLELSLGLGLALSTTHKWKASETSTNPPPPPPHHHQHTSSTSSADLMAGNPSLPSGSNTSSLKSIMKPNGKTNSGLDAALKKFLEGKLGDDDEEEEGEGEGEGEENGEEEKKHSVLGSSSEQAFEQKKLRKEEGKEEGKEEEEGQRNPFLFKEIHVSSSTRGNIVPLFVDAFKMGSENGEEECLEQQRRIQEDRVKRKFVVEEATNQKKGKVAKDDPIGTTSHGFRLPGSNTWMPGLDADRSLLSLSGEQEATKLDDKVGQARVKTTDKAYEHDDNESVGVDQNHENTAKGEVSTGVEVNFMPQFKAQDMATNREMSRSNGGDDVWRLGTTKGQSQSREKFGMGGPGLPSKKEQEVRIGTLVSGGTRERGKVPSETSSTGTDGTDKTEEKSHRGTGEASSVPNESIVNDKAILTSISSPFPSVLATDGRPFTMQSSFHSGSVPFFPSNFPYMMSHAPTGSDGQAHNAPIQPPIGSAFQSTFGPPERPLISSMEGTAPWMHVLRSHGGLPAVKPQGTKVTENGPATVDGASPHGNHPFYRALAQNGSQDPTVAISHLHRQSDLPLISSPGTLPQFASQIMQTDTADHRSLKDQGGGSMNVFPGFASSQGLQGSVRTPSSSTKEDKGETHHIHNRNNSLEPNHIVAQEEIRRALGGQFHQGTTDNLSAIDALGDDIANLQRGMVPGLKFGGTGTAPDLPWVHTTAPNGRTIGGVLYRFGPSQLKIVCACHGKHMSPVEFTQHASVDMSN